MGNSLKLGTIFGIPIRLHYTWFLIFALVTFSLSWQYFPSVYPQWSVVQYWVVGIATSLLFFGSVITHELAHSLVSKRNGTPVKSITLFIFGGVAHISREASRPMAELAMAAAGPLSSLVLGGFFALVALVARPVNEPVAALGSWLFRINVMLALFNLIPGFPLDGGRVLRSLLWHFTGNYKRATRTATLAGQGVAYLFILGGILIMFIWRDWFSGLWLAFIGWFLDNAASASYRQAMLRESLQGYTARDVMTQDAPVVNRGLTLRQLVRDYVLPTGRRFYLVVDGDRLEGIMTLHNIKTVPESRWDTTPVGEAMTPREKLQIAPPEEEAMSLLERMDEGDINQVPVVSEGRVVGMVARDNLLRFIRTRSELGA